MTGRPEAAYLLSAAALGRREKGEHFLALWGGEEAVSSRVFSLLRLVSRPGGGRDTRASPRPRRVRRGSGTAPSPGPAEPPPHRARGRRLPPSFPPSLLPAGRWRARPRAPAAPAFPEQALPGVGAGSEGTGGRLPAAPTGGCPRLRGQPARRRGRRSPLFPFRSSLFSFPSSPLRGGRRTQSRLGGSATGPGGGRGGGGTSPVRHIPPLPQDGAGVTPPAPRGPGRCPSRRAPRAGHGWAEHRKEKRSSWDQLRRAAAGDRLVRERLAVAPVRSRFRAGRWSRSRPVRHCRFFGMEMSKIPFLAGSQTSAG